MHQDGSIDNLLQALSLSEKEVQVIHTLLVEGEQTATAISNSTGITRTSMYDVIRSLKDKGLVLGSATPGVKRFGTLDHAGFIAYLSRKERELGAVKKQFSDAASAFADLRHKSNRTMKVRFVHGREGVSSLYEELRRDLKAVTMEKRQIITVWPVQKLEDALPGFFDTEQYFNLPGLYKRDIMVDSSLAREYFKRYDAGPAKHEYRLWPEEMGELPTDALCWGDKVVYTDVMGPATGLIIENAAIAETFRKYFEIMWQSLPEPT